MNTTTKNVKRVREIEADGSRVIAVSESNGYTPPVASWAAVDLNDIVGTSAAGRPIHVARDGHINQRVVIIHPE